MDHLLSSSSSTRFIGSQFHRHSILRSTTIEPPSNDKKLQKIEAIKLNSNYLRSPLEEEMKNDEVFVANDAVIVLKYHGSYMQDNRDNRKKGEKDYSFMLRLKSPW